MGSKFSQILRRIVFFGSRILSFNIFEQKLHATEICFFARGTEKFQWCKNSLEEF